jgi:hypothetical protein
MNDRSGKTNYLGKTDRGFTVYITHMTFPQMQTLANGTAEKVE